MPLIDVKHFSKIFFWDYMTIRWKAWTTFNENLIFTVVHASKIKQRAQFQTFKIIAFRY
jgi:hypothetical protein